MKGIKMFGKNFNNRKLYHFSIVGPFLTAYFSIGIWKI